MTERSSGWGPSMVLSILDLILQSGKVGAHLQGVLGSVPQPEVVAGVQPVGHVILTVS